MHSYLRSHCSLPSKSESKNRNIITLPDIMVKNYHFYAIHLSDRCEIGKQTDPLKLRIFHISEISAELSSWLKYMIRYSSVMPSVCYSQQSIVIYWEARVLLMSDLQSLSDCTSSKSIHPRWINAILIS